MVLVTSLGHPLAERDKVALAEIAAESLALPRPSICAGYLAQVEALLERHGVRLPERVSVRHWNTAVSFASTGRELRLDRPCARAGARIVRQRRDLGWSAPNRPCC